mgnify:CR=1 FL=1|tara:strand:+ start:118 stop:780 length:663 start_codon:yes stop_codon:yes gene_type:complete
METAIGITIFDKDTTEIGQTDYNGYFQIKLLKETDKFIFAGLGYEWATISIPKECENAEIILFLASTHCFDSPAKVDRLRKKEFEKLFELHYQAFQNGLFKTEKPCFNRKFEPYKPELDEIGLEMKLTKKQIKTKFKELKNGDIVKVPTQTWSAYTYATDFGCLISGIIIAKNKKKGGYNLIIKVTDNLCEKDYATYGGNPVNIGESITHNMKYFKIITD